MPSVPKPLETARQLNELITSVTKTPGYRQPIGFGIAHVTFGQANKGTTIMARYPAANWGQNFGSAAAMLYAAGLVQPDQSVDDRLIHNELVLPLDDTFTANLYNIFGPLHAKAVKDQHSNVQVAKMIHRLGKANLNSLRLVMLFGDEPVKSPEAAYLKLYALSSRKVQPGIINMDGVADMMPRLAWIGSKPQEPEAIQERYLADQIDSGMPHITALSKFPDLLDHVLLKGITIDGGATVRLGAHLATGTEVGAGGFVDFNAGSLGPAIIHGKLLTGVTVGAGTVIDSGAKVAQSLGENCRVATDVFLGPNSTVEIGQGQLAEIASSNPHLQERTVTSGGDLKIHAKDLSGSQGETVKNVEFYREDGRLKARHRTSDALYM